MSSLGLINSGPFIFVIEGTEKTAEFGVVKGE